MRAAGLALLGLLGCRKQPPPAPPGDAGPGVSAAGRAAVEVVGPGYWDVPPLQVGIPAGFVASSLDGWLVRIGHLETGALLRVGLGAPSVEHPGFVQVFSDDGDYRSGPGGALAATETWLALDLAGPTLMVLDAQEARGLHVELELPLHAELPSLSAFEPVIAALRLDAP